MSCKRLGFPLTLAALAVLSGCQRQPARPSLERIAILRFENLGPDLSNDWMGRAFAEIVTSELTGAPGIYAIPGGRVHAVAAGLGVRPVAAPGISAERTPALAAGATKIAFGQYTVRGGTLEARVTLEDELTGKMTVLNPVSAPAGDIVSAATAVARQISTHVTPYGTKNSQVVKAYVNAFEGIGNPGVADQLAEAVAADPNFGPTYRQLAQLKVRENDIAGAREFLHRALARGNAIPDS